MAKLHRVVNLRNILSKYHGIKMKIIEEDLILHRKPTLYKLRVFIKNKKAKTREELFYFVKTCEQDVKVNIRVCLLSGFETEVQFYLTAVPAMTEFQRRNGIYARTYQTLFPKCIEARISAEQDKRISDETGVLIFEHLGKMGYTDPNPREGLTISACEIVLANLAEMHATPIAMRILCLDDFMTKVVPCLITTTQPERSFRSYKKIDEMLEELGEFDFEIKTYLPTIKRAIKFAEHNVLSNDTFSDESWMTLCHSNFSLSNLMIKYDKKTGITTGCKILDFQSLQYSDCFTDLLFFLLTSAETNLFKSFDFMLEWYYNSFVQVLMEYDIDLTDYSRDHFEYYINRQAPNLIIKILQSLPYIMCKRYRDDGELMLNDNFKQRMRDIIFLFISREWIDD
ncbi:hypothetical protein GWI33_006662 [Rhynchophorus ferrugineus]|uniref:CHK kinase-like domain-containing protein n=1 Tax=Rhynchophorus ferrugineus TaxID=354439 RepID=A0A834MH59_RHYFE|nr:hypothetical protein GWI33_006662 [Rhynchophorus ferrugineus]